MFCSHLLYVQEVLTHLHSKLLYKMGQDFLETKNSNLLNKVGQDFLDKQYYCQIRIDQDVDPDPRSKNIESGSAILLNVNILFKLHVPQVQLGAQ